MTSCLHLRQPEILLYCHVYYLLSNILHYCYIKFTVKFIYSFQFTVFVCQVIILYNVLYTLFDIV